VLPKRFMLSAVLSYILAGDTALLLMINQGLSQPVLDVFFSAITYLGYVWLWIPLAFIILFYRRLLGRRLITGLIATNALVFFLKELFMRPRPDMVLHGLHIFDTDTLSSFPSGHAANAVMIAYILAQSYPKYANYFYVLAGIVCFSRVYLGAHYPLDVVAGAILGLTVAWTVVKRVAREKKEKAK
jgi:undecaprenyl-diphosphatase